MEKTLKSHYSTAEASYGRKATNSAASRKCLGNCLDESIAAQSAKLKSIALNPKVIFSEWEKACGCSGDQVSESKRIHQTVKTQLVGS